MLIISKALEIEQFQAIFDSFDSIDLGYNASEKKFLIFRILAAILNVGGNQKCELSQKPLEREQLQANFGPFGIYRPWI